MAFSQRCFELVLLQVESEEERFTTMYHRERRVPLLIVINHTRRSEAEIISAPSPLIAQRENPVGPDLRPLGAPFCERQ